MSEEATLDEFVNSGSNSDTTEKDLMTSLDETSVGRIPSDWSTVRLGDLTENTLYGANESAEDYDPDKPRYIRIKDIDEQGRLKESEKASLSPDKAQGYHLEEGDMLFARSGSPGRTYLHRDDEGEYCYGGYSIKHELVSDGLNHEYLSQYTKSQKYWDWIERIARTGAQANINSREYASLLVPLPPLPEQRKIATVLQTVDQAIKKTGEIVEQLDTLKSGVVQQVFTEGTRYHESNKTTKSGKVPEEWELVRFEEVITDTRYGTDNKSNTASNGYPTLRIPNVVNKRITIDDLKHTPLDEDEVERLRLEDGDILVLRTNGNPDYVGRCATFQERDETFVFASYLIRVRVDESRVRPAYIREFLNSPRGRSEMAGWIRSSAGNYNLSVGAMEKFQIPIPSLEEQDEMVDKITEVEKTIETNRGYLDNLQRLKRGLMQDLFSGTVRTNDTNIEVPDKIAQHG